jgi:excisionase family DNA binding protein
MLTVEEVAAILKVQPLTVRQMFREGRIRGFKIGKAWRTTMPILEEDIACMSRGVTPPRLEQATPSADAQAPVEKTVPIRKKRPKAAAETETPAAPEPAETPETVAVAVEELPAAPEVPAVEEPDTGGKRKRKPAPEEYTDQQLLF